MTQLPEYEGSFLQAILTKTMDGNANLTRDSVITWDGLRDDDIDNLTVADYPIDDTGYAIDEESDYDSNIKLVTWKSFCVCLEDLSRIK